MSASQPWWEKSKEIVADHWKHLLPTLVWPFMHWCQETSYGWHEGPGPVPINCECRKNSCRVEVTAVYMDHECRLENHLLSYCECHPLALTLLGIGLFPASLICPSIAFSLGHLLVVSKLFIHISPTLLPGAA
ncbi:hypothetical protein BS47DRAFT_1309699 [Hydnum rufescens UP504]|uniref:CxC1-like cysteine cluster associated with KDZ transposases domain-containing protein n=1 Tax=Hydnum rufescens UP504 TaxID=1448309 RepID=A0A9P6ADE8_9AGAM|nr:hypothetical protein BS47DRAFT_1309699 [Hydnum rufescens UP504]